MLFFSVQAAGRAIESDYVFILLVKAQQLTQMKDFEESMALLTEIERVFRDKPISSQKIKAEQYLQILKTDLKMAEYNDNKGKYLTTYLLLTKYYQRSFKFRMNL